MNKRIEAAIDGMIEAFPKHRMYWLCQFNSVKDRVTRRVLLLVLQEFRQRMITQLWQNGVLS
jgi:hypothetical protein